MAAVFPVFYLVRPSALLLAHVAEHPEAKTLGESVVVSQSQPFPVDHDYVGQTEDHETFAKLCYLASRERDRALSNDAALSELLGSAPLTVAVFDRWWSLERIGLGFVDLDRSIDEIPVDVLKKIEGPRERSPRAEQAAREHERTHHERQSAAIDPVTGLPPSPMTIEPWPRSVGAWWEDVIARRSRGGFA